MTPDFTKLPDPEPMDPHQRGVNLLLVLMAILAAVMAYGVFWK